MLVILAPNVAQNKMIELLICIWSLGIVYAMSEETDIEVIPLRGSTLCYDH